MPDPKLMKCKFCEYTTPRWHTTKTGRKKYGLDNLLAHTYDEHAAQAPDPGTLTMFKTRWEEEDD